MTSSTRIIESRYAEAHTNDGLLVSFATEPEKVDEVKEMFSKVVHLDIPTSHRVNVSHGGYGRYSRYNIEQHKYAGGGPGEGGGWSYIEVLEVKDPPDGRRGFILHEAGSHLDGGSMFSEWQTLEDAINAYEQTWGKYSTREDLLPTLNGYIRTVHCGALSAWFYAIGTEELIGDYAFPVGMEDDPVFRFGKKFIVEDEDGVPAVKTCMGCRLLEHRTSSYYGHDRETTNYRLVVWDDGTTWSELRQANRTPRPLEEGEQWIAEAITQFRTLLSGRQKEFSIEFLDGTRFVGKVLAKNPKKRTSAGKYDVVVKFKNGQERQGWFDFEPTTEYPTVPDYLAHLLRNVGEIESITVRSSRPVKGKKWAGVYHANTSQE
jgi:hypothetical protein